MFFFMLTLC